MPPASINEKEEGPSNVDRAMRVFEENGDFIRKIIRFNIKNKAEVDDLFQDFFLFLLSKPMPEKVQNVRGLLYRMVTDKTKDAFRRIIRYQARLNRYAECHRCIIENCPENIVIEVEETKKMFELIRRRLPPNEARAVRLRYWDSYDTGEVAEKMGIKPSSVSRYVSVGLKRVRQLFGVNKGNSYDSF